MALLSLAAPALLAGVFQAPGGLYQGWRWSGAFVYPVGDPYQISTRPYHGAPRFYVMRGFFEPEDGDRAGTPPHQGVDLSNGRGGDVVRAASHGIVVLVEPRDTVTRFGCRVVLAHRLPDGSLAYSVYAHLRPGSIQVRQGDLVSIAEPIGRVGRSGNATGNHLHFELRRPRDPSERWEKTPAVDPLPFLAAWIPGHRADSSRAGRYLEWAEEAALIGPREEGRQALTRGAWREMLARAARHPIRSLPARADSLRLALIACSVLPVGAETREAEPVPWKEVIRDVERVRTLGVRLPPPPLPAAAHSTECARAFGAGRPSEHLETLARATTTVARADACLLLADLAVVADSAAVASRATPPARTGSRTAASGPARHRPHAHSKAPVDSTKAVSR